MAWSTLYIGSIARFLHLSVLIEIRQVGVRQFQLFYRFLMVIVHKSIHQIICILLQYIQVMVLHPLASKWTSACFFNYAKDFMHSTPQPIALVV